MNGGRFHCVIISNKKSSSNISSPYFMLTHNGNQALRDTYCTLIKTFFKFNIKAIAKSPFK